MAEVQFDVDDTSPTISYSPFGDTFSTPNFTAGWNPLFNQTSFGGAPLEVGNSTSIHVTSCNEAALSVRWKGTAIQLVGSATAATYSVTLDGSQISLESAGVNDTTLASFAALNNTDHTIVLTAIIPSSTENQTQSFIVFDKAVIFASPSNTTDNSTYTPQPLNDSDINFRGKWSFDPNGVHVSSSAGDQAYASFIGTTFEILGTLSPDAGNFTVMLDNSTVQYSAKASFTQNNSLLFFASGLDPNKVHSFGISNDDGGTLVLPVGGFTSFSSGNPNPSGLPSPSPAPSAIGANTVSNSLSQGTIAALALAGILAFILISGSLFCVLVYRPRRLKRRQARREGRHKPENIDTSVVLNIGPEASHWYSPRSVNGSRPASTRTGFSRWKQEVENGNGGRVLGALGLVFRHSDSGKAKPDPASFDDDILDDGEPRSAKSFSFPPSPQSDQKQKGKGRWTGKSKSKKNSSSSPSFTIDLPPLQAQPKERSSDPAPSTPSQPQRSPFSAFTSLTYMSTPTGASRQLSFNEPSTRNSQASSPRVPPSPSFHGRTDSHGLLLMRDSHDGGSEGDSDYRSSIGSHQDDYAPQVIVHEVEVSSSYNASRSRLSLAPTQGEESTGPGSRSERVSRDIDRGSVRTYDDTMSVLGPATARAAIRSLSPRTSEVVFGTSGRTTDVAREFGLVPGLSFGNLVRQSVSAAPEAAQRTPRGPPEAARPADQGPFLDVRASSPFQVDFAGRPSRYRPVSGESVPAKSSRLSGVSRVRFEEDQLRQSPKDADKDKGKGKASDYARNEELLAPQGARSSFRLTPQHTLTSPISGSGGSGGVTSFLDFEGSSDPSFVTQSNDTSSSSRRDSTYSSQPQAVRSRWSSTTIPSSHNTKPESSDSQGSGASVSSPSSTFPFPVSLPASPHHPEGYKPSPPTSPSRQPSAFGMRPESASLHSHPSGLSTNPVSPAESVPISISDLYFRHSDSEEAEDRPTTSTSSHLPPHPPLPSVPNTPTYPQTASEGSMQTSGLSTPGYIVNRVFTHDQSDSAFTSDSQTPTGRRTFGDN